jgi:membrane protein implicated in regulation of membrane protease activity
MKSWIRDNSLSLALLLLFAASFVGQVFAGWAQENEALAEHDQALLTLWGFLTSGEFLSAVFENWESEFLQMWAYVMLTAYLFQRGSPESKDPDKPSPQDRDPALDADNPETPGAVRKGGLVARLYSHSLGLAMLTLFLLSFVLHWVNSARGERQQALEHGEPPPSLLEHLIAPQLWFESFQNWQSEFLSTAVLVVLAIWLREKGSPESKPVSAPHAQTGAG